MHWLLKICRSCLPMAQETRVQSQVESYQRLKKWYLILPCLTLSIIRYISRVKWSNPRKGVAPSPTPRYSSYWKGSFWVALDYGCQQLRMDCKSKNNPDKFCYICSNELLPTHQAKITDFMKKAYHNYFGVKLGDQDKPFTPHICCITCVKNLRDWRRYKWKSMAFAIPMVRREGKDHIVEWYFCIINLKGINCKNKRHV